MFRIYSKRDFIMGVLTSELVDHHWNEIVVISHEIIRRVIDNLRERLRQWVDNNGKHLRDAIFQMK